MERRCANFAAYLRFTAFGLFVGGVRFAWRCSEK